MILVVRLRWGEILPVQRVLLLPLFFHDLLLFLRREREPERARGVLMAPVCKSPTGKIATGVVLGLHIRAAFNCPSDDVERVLQGGAAMRD